MKRGGSMLLEDDPGAKLARGNGVQQLDSDLGKVSSPQFQSTLPVMVGSPSSAIPTPAPGNTLLMQLQLQQLQQQLFQQQLYQEQQQQQQQQQQEKQQQQQAPAPASFQPSQFQNPPNPHARTGSKPEAANNLLPMPSLSNHQSFSGLGGGFSGAAPLQSRAMPDMPLFGFLGGMQSRHDNQDLMNDMTSKTQLPP